MGVVGPTSNSSCKKHLLDHVLHVQDQVEGRMDSIEQQLDGKCVHLRYIFYIINCL